MIRRHARIKFMILGLLAAVLLLLVSAVAWPDQEVRRVFFAIVLLTSITLLLSFIALVWARLEKQEEEILLLRRDLTRRIASHEAETEFDAMASRWKQTSRAWERSVS